MPSRRQFLAAAGVAAVGVGAQPASAERSWQSIADDAPDHITRSFDEALLEDYKPYLVIRHLGSNTPSALYGYVARSTEFDYTMLVYWAEYPFQDGAIPGGWDSHFGDHEPIYVRVDEQEGELIDVSYSAYHWLRGWTATPVLSESEGTHPLFYVADPWHHYTTTAEEGVNIDLATLDDDELSTWWNNGWDEAIYPQALTEPWIMAGANGRSDWWHETAGSFSFEATLRQVYLTAGLFGADQSDLS